MKGPVVAVERSARLTRAALMVDGQLAGLEIDRHGENIPQPGAIYRCRITQLVPAIGAAFADVGDDLSGFFPDAKGLTAGQIVLAQVRREPEGDKAARLSSDLQYRGKAVVFTPQRPGINVSRKIGDGATRARLAALLAPLAGEGGFVLRTAARLISPEALMEEARALVEGHGALCDSVGELGKVAPEPDAVTRLYRRIPDSAPVFVNDECLATIAGTTQVEPNPFDRLGIDSRIAEMLAPRIALGEGWISIDPTPALVAVDVNTGDARRGNALLRVNLDVASRLPLILALRRLGGIVIVDFAGAPKGDARKRIEGELMRSVHLHLEKPRIHGWGPAGLFEMGCARVGRSLADLLKEDDV